MGQFNASRSSGELARIWNNRPDASMYFDSVQSATTPQSAPRVFVPRYRLVFQDHFLGLKDARWNVSTQNSPTTAAIQNAKNGVFRLIIAATSEAERNELNFNDVLPFDTTSGLVMEVGFKPVAGYGANEDFFIGFGTARNNTYASMTRRAGFGASGDNNLCTQSDDTTTDTGLIDTGQDLTAGQWHYGRIEFKSATDIWFSSGSGVPTRVNSSTTFTTGATLVQPILSTGKASGTGVPSLDLDYVAIFART
jgi:hypothetical protein